MNYQFSGALRRTLHHFANCILGMVAFVMFLLPTSAEVPRMLNHQGRIAVNGVNFEGTGQFKFALVNADGSSIYWSNDGTMNVGSSPASAITLPVVKGLYSVLLGDTSIPNMTALSASVFLDHDVWLRVWFNDGTNGFQLITPDQRLAATPFALVANTAEKILLEDVLTSPARPVVAWGRNSNGQTTLPVLSSVVAIAAGESHSMALLKNGTVVTWGLIAATPAGLSGVTHIAASGSHCLARKSDGTVVAWGDNTYGQGTVPGGLTNVSKIAAGEKHNIALKADGTVFAWGDNTFGQTSVPPGLNNVIAIAAGNDHNLALKSDGSLVVWGRNDAGQIDVPVGVTNVATIGAGAYHSLAVLQNGTVAAWGFNLGGQSDVPSGLSNVVQIEGGYDFSVALKNDGTVVAWGDSADNRITVPANTTTITSIATGASHTLALRADLGAAPLARLDQDNVFDGKVGIKRVPTANTLEVEGNASKTIAGGWLANSDRRIKTDIQPVTEALEKLDQVRLVKFRYTDAYREQHPGIEDKNYLNVIAQEFAEVFPSDVKSSGEYLPDGSPIMQVDTYPLTIYSAAAVQELHRENLELKRKLADQEERLRKLEAHINR